MSNPRPTKKARLRVLPGGQVVPCESAIDWAAMESMGAAELISYITDVLAERFRKLKVESVEIVKLPRAPFAVYVCGGFPGAPLRCTASALRDGLEETVRMLERIENEGRRPPTRPTLAPAGQGD